jgi:hypothetical protein
MIQGVGDELVVYDSRHQRAHTLNSIAATVFRYSDGSRTIDEIASHLSSDQGLPQNEELVWLTLEQLAKADLLTEAVQTPRTLSADRRSMLVAAAIALPFIESILVPSAASARSDFGTAGPTGGPVTGGPVTGGPVTGGPVTGGPVTGGPVTGGPVTGGPVTGGPVTGGPVTGGPVTGGPVTGGPVTGGPVTSGPVDGAALGGAAVLLGQRFSEKYGIAAAEPRDPQAIDAMAQNNLGWTRQIQGDSDGAIASYRKALQLDPHLRIARRNLAILLVTLGQRDASFDLWREEVLADAEGLAWLQGLMSSEMQRPDLRLASEYASIHAQLRWGSRWYPPRWDDSLRPLSPVFTLTIPKLLHDIEQFEYLQRHGLLDNELTSIIEDYQRAIVRLVQRGIDRAPLENEDSRTIGHVYNRIVHVRDTPRCQRALSDRWDATAAESQYINNPPGIIVLDDFLSREALESLRLFCLESTVWSTNRYAHGRLGAFFESGFNCPLLIQIAEEVQQVLPRVIGNRYPLRQMWAFKCGQTLPEDASTHADFAAVNVNFWITPDDANLDDSSGGFVVYDVDAPLDWDFQRYQTTPWSTLNPFLRQQNARAITIPYRQNRAIIFNSDLFHGTAALRFKPGYENRRVNITMLYGDRENDVHHPQLGSLRNVRGS